MTKELWSYFGRLLRFLRLAFALGILLFVIFFCRFSLSFPLRLPILVHHLGNVVLLVEYLGDKEPESLLELNRRA